jgi:polygalacturonase
MNRNQPIIFFLVFLLQTAPVFSQLEWPPLTSQSRPWTRWWWMGSAVDTGGLRVNMEKYRAAGLGGLELTPIYGVKGYEDRFVDYLSPKWMDLFGFTLREASRLGLGLDMSTGTGWPFGGGPLIDSVYACKELFYKTWSVKAGDGLVDNVEFIQEPLVHTDGFPKPSIEQLVEPVFSNANRQALALDQVRFKRHLPLLTLMAYSASGLVLDLSARVDPSGHLDWTAPANPTTASPASGSWTLYALFQGAHGKMVERAAPGAEGNAIDHFSAAALTKYLSRFDTAFSSHDLSGLRAFFNDSYEVDDSRGISDWTPGFFDLFRAYRGYDLKDHLPALFGKDTSQENGQVLCDYRETISDLLLDKFTLGWRGWAQRKGGVIRDQAHGSPANILDLYAAADIPETEGSELLRYKFATSAAHVMGKRLASAETVTWLNEHFLSSLGDIKTAVDNYWLGGVNHIFYHGTAYSPPTAPWPGWLFYASVHFTPNDPSWQNFSTLNQYIARCQSFLQQGSSDNDVLLYYPLYDSWSDRGRDLLKHYDKMDPEFDGTGFKDCAVLMQTNGYTFDYISDRQLRQTRTCGTGNQNPGIRTVGAGLYRTVVIPDCRYISNEALAALIRLADSGAMILVVKKLPADPPGWDADGHRRNAFRSMSERMRFIPASDAAGIQKAAIGKGAFMMGDDIAALLAYAKIRREPMIGDSLEFVRRKSSEGACYFIVNRTSRKWDGAVALSTPFAAAAIFDPMTGLSGLASRPSAPNNDQVYLQLEPGASVIIKTFRIGTPRSPHFHYYRPAGPALPVSGVWQLKFLAGGPSLPPPVKLRQLGSWTALDGQDVKAFSGTAAYSIAFAAPAPTPASTHVDAWSLDLGTVDATAQVFLNTKKIATLIGPDFRVIIPAASILRTNKLEIRVSNLMVNRIEDMDRKGIPWKIFYNTNFPAHFKENRGAGGLFDAAAWKPLNSGLSGPVTITLLHFVSNDAASVFPATPKQDDPPWTRQVGARSFPANRQFLRVNDYGAVGDGSTLSTEAIQTAIDTCSARGGGVVSFLPGIYLSGSLFIKDNVELRIGTGVELKGSQRFEDYPEIDTRIAGIEMKWPAALLNMIGVKNAALTGEGKVNAQGKFCWDKYWAMRKDYEAKGLRWIVDYDAKRIRTLLIQRSSDITVSALRFVDAGFWTIQVLYSQYITIDGVVIRNNENGHGPSTDGVDIDSSSWVLVQHCDIDCNDDDFCLKAGRDWDGLRVNRPTEYVVIRKCIARKGGGLLTIGSETSGSIRHVLATDLAAKGTGNGFHIKSATTRGGTVEDIHVRHITMDSVGNAILFTMNWNPAYSYAVLPKGYNEDSIPQYWKTLLHKIEPAEKGIPHFHDIYISDISVRSAKTAISAQGLDRSIITGVHITDMNVHAVTAGSIEYARDWDFNGVIISAKDNSTLQMQHAGHIQMK